MPYYFPIQNLQNAVLLGLSEIRQQKGNIKFQYKPTRKQLKELVVTKSIQQLAAEIKDAVVFIKNK